MGLVIAVATHSDQAATQLHFGRRFGARQRHFDEQVAQAFFIVAYNPRARGTADNDAHCSKRYHRKELQRHFAVSASEILFFDDTAHVVQDCSEVCGVLTVQVDPQKGFQLSNLLQVKEQASSSSLSSS